MNKIKNLIIFFVLISISLYPLFASEGSLPSLFGFGVGGTAKSMAGAFTAVADDPSGVNWNPAGLGQIRSREILFQVFNSFQSSLSIFYSSFVNPISLENVFGISLVSVNIDNLLDTLNYREFNARDNLFSVSYARGLQNKIFLGGTLKLLMQTIDDLSATTVDADIGLLYKPVSFFSSGLVLKNLLPFNYRFTSASKSDTIPLSVTAGIKFSFLKNRLIFSVDGGTVVVSGSSLKWSMGICGYPFEYLLVMAGINEHFKFSSGIGVSVKDIKLQTGMEINSTDTLDFQVSLIYRLKETVDTTGRELDYFYKGTVFYNNRDYRNAIRYFNKVLEIREDPTARYYLENSKKYLASESFLTDEEKELIRYNLERAKKARQVDDTGTAIQAYRDILNINPEHREALEGIEELKKQTDPEVQRLYNEALSLFKIKKYQESYDKVKFSLAINPEHQPSIELKERCEKVLKDILAEEQRREQRRIEAKTLYDEGLAKYREERWPEAIANFQKSLDVDPSNTNARIYLEKAKENLKISKSMQDRKKDAERFFKNGLAAYQDKRLKEAIDEFEKAVTTYPDYKEAAEYLRKTQSEYDEMINTPLEEGKVALRENRLGDAIKSFEKVLTIDPQHPVAKEFLNKSKSMIKDAIVRYNANGDMKLKQGKYDEALREYSQVLLLEPDNNNAIAGSKVCREKLKDIINRYMDLGIQQFNNQEYKKAIENFEKVLSIDPDYILAKDYLEKAKTEFEKNKTVILQREKIKFAKDALVNRDYSTAKKNFEEALQIDPNSPLASEARDGIKKCEEQMSLIEKDMQIAEKFKEGVIAYKAQKYEDAIAIWTSIKTIDPANSLVDQYIAYAKTAQQQRGNKNFIEGQEAFKKGDLIAAREAFKKAIEIDPANQKAKELLGQVNSQIIKESRNSLQKAESAFKAGRYEEALPLFENVLKYEPENEEVLEKKILSEELAEWTKNGISSLQKGDYADAIDNFMRVLNANPDDNRALDNYNKAINEGKRLAQQWLVEADNFIAENKLRQAFSRLNSIVRSIEGEEKVKAQTKLAEVEKMIDNQLKTSYSKGVEYKSQGKYKLAIDEFDKVLELKNPYKDTVALREKCVREVERQKTQDMEALKKKAQEHMLLGQQYYRDNKLKEAIAEWEEVLKIFPDDEQAKKYISRAKYKLQAEGQ